MEISETIEIFFFYFFLFVLKNFIANFSSLSKNKIQILKNFKRLFFYINKKNIFLILENIKKKEPRNEKQT